MSTFAVPVLDAESQAFPSQLLRECSSALLLFCSGRMGAADGHWVKQANLKDVTCVDWDAATLDPFVAAYPRPWHYHIGDAWEFVAAADRVWDLVSADPPSQYRDLMIPSLVDWCSVAAKYVTATVMQEDVTAPHGWSVGDVIPRASYDDGRSYFWAVLERA